LSPYPENSAEDSRRGSLLATSPSKGKERKSSLKRELRAGVFLWDTRKKIYPFKRKSLIYQKRERYFFSKGLSDIRRGTPSLKEISSQCIWQGPSRDASRGGILLSGGSPKVSKVSLLRGFGGVRGIWALRLASREDALSW